MAIPWGTFFKEPTSISGFSSGAVTAMDEWPFVASDNAFVQDTAGASSTPILNFNLGAAPGDKKGFVLWLGLHVDTAAGFSLDELRIKDGTTLLYTDAAPAFGPLGDTSITTTTMRIYFYQIPDSVWATDPDIDDLNIEIDVTNLHSGNNRLRFDGARLSKSPFAAAAEATPPSTVDGNNFSCFRASDLYDLGGVDDEEIIVWPDASGRGMHLLRWEISGTGANLHDDDGEYVDFPEGSGTHFLFAFGPIVTGNHLHHVRGYLYEGSVGATESRVFLAHARTNTFPTQGVPGDKNILALDNDGAGDQWVIMSGDGTGPAHFHGGTASQDIWHRLTQWVQDAGNEHLWENADASPVIDAASGSNNMTVFGVGSREDFNSARHLEGRISELWFIDANGFTEANIDDARDEWMAGGSSATGTAAWTEEDDTLAATGAVGAAGTATWIEEDDTMAGTGVVGVTGAGAWSEEDDTLAASGGHAEFIGSAAWSEEDDTLAGVGAVGVAGTMAWSEEDDVLSASGTGGSGGPVNGTGAWSEENDLLAAFGTVGGSSLLVKPNRGGITIDRG